MHKKCMYRVGGIFHSIVLFLIIDTGKNAMEIF